MQQDFERRSDRGRGDPDRGRFTQRGDDREYDRVYDNYGEGSGEYDPRQRRSQGSSGSERERTSDRERYDREPRQDRYTDEMRGDSRTRQDRGEQRRFEQERFEQRQFEQGRRSGPGDASSFDIRADDWTGEHSGRRSMGRGYDEGRSGRSSGYDQRGYDQRSGGRSGSPYDQGEMSSWYGGDSGMGDAGSSLPGGQQDRWQFDRGQSGWSQQGRGQFGQRDAGWRESSQRQASSQFGQPRYGQQQYDQDQYRERFSGSQQPSWSGNWQNDWYRSMDDSWGNRRSIEGPFTGRGPRGYRRSDERIREDVCELLTRHGDIDASQMEVEVHEAVVMLRGMADSGRVRRLTEEVVEGVTGVRDVRNDLRVNQRTGYAEAMPSDMDRPDTGRSDMGRSDWDRGETGRRETSQTGMRQGGTSSTSDTGTSGYDSGSQAYPMGPASSQSGSRSTIRQGMDVVGSDGVIVGQVKEVRGTDFLVSRPMQRDVYVPTSAIQTVEGDRVMLNTPARDVDNQNWPTPDLTGASQQPTR